MRQFYSGSSSRLAAAVAIGLVGGLLASGPAGAAASPSSPGTADSATVERLGTVDVRNLATSTAQKTSNTTMQNESGPWTHEVVEKPTTSAPASLPAPSPANRPLVINQNRRGWEGLTHADQRLAGGGNQFSLEPPDQGLCAGGNSPNGPGNGPEVVESVNDAITFYDGTSHQLTAPITLSQFYGLKPTFNRTTGEFGPFVSDPKCYFDADTQRWFHTVLTIAQDPKTGAFRAPTNVYIAVSASKEALGPYYIYRINATHASVRGCPCLPDQPLIGADKYGFYVSVAEYGLFTTAFHGPQIYAMDKVALEQGGTRPGVVLIRNVKHVVGDRTTGTVQPAMSFNGVYETRNNGTEYFMSSFECTPGPNCPVAAGQFNKITVWALTNTRSLRTGTPNLHLSLRDLTSEVYGTPVPQHQRPGPRPLGNSVDEPLGKPSANDSRMNQVVFADGLLWSALNTVVNPGPRDGIAYFILKPYVTNGQVGGTIRNQGYVAAANTYLSFPSVAVNGSGNGIIAFSAMGPNLYPSAAQIDIGEGGATGAVEVVGLGYRPEDGFTCYTAFTGDKNPVCRWGDYSAAVATPSGQIYAATEWIGNDTRTLFANWSTFVWPAQ